MKEYFAFDHIDWEITFHDTAEEAKAEADKSLEFYRDQSRDEGWPESVESMVGYGKILGSAVKTNEIFRSDHTEEEWDEMGNSEWDSTVDYEIEENKK